MSCIVNYYALWYLFNIYKERLQELTIYNKSEYCISDYTVHVELSVYPDHTTGTWLHHGPFY